MKILYGVQGTGNGHLSRARQLGPELVRLGAEIDWVMTGRHPDQYFDMSPFPNYQTLPGLTFQVRNGQIQLLETCRKLAIKQSIRDIRQLNTKAYDLVISDYEPITAWAAKLQKTPSLGLAHQYAFLHPSVPKMNHHLMGNALLKYFAPTQMTLGLHWHHFNAPILPPIFGVGSAPDNQLLADPTQVLVYLPHDAIAELLPLFNAQPHHQFHVFTQEIAPQQMGSVQIHALSRPDFLRTLHQCAHVLCAAGFELVSEALSLGRNIMVKPLKQQTEQVANARALNLLEYAQVCYELKAHHIHHWLAEGNPVRVRYPNVAKALARQIMTGHWHTLAEDMMDLWQDCAMPDTSFVRSSRLALNSQTALTDS